MYFSVVLLYNVDISGRIGQIWKAAALDPNKCKYGDDTTLTLKTPGQLSGRSYAAQHISPPTLKEHRALHLVMPAVSTLSDDEKSRVKSAIPKSSNKINTVALARVYYAHPNPNDWSYAGLQGALAFTFDSTRNAFYFRLVDLVGTRGIMWEHELYEGFEYYQDRAYFHSFPGDVSGIAHLFIPQLTSYT